MLEIDADGFCPCGARSQFYCTCEPPKARTKMDFHGDPDEGVVTAEIHFDPYSRIQPRIVETTVKPIPRTFWQWVTRQPPRWLVETTYAGGEHADGN